MKIALVACAAAVACTILVAAPERLEPADCLAAAEREFAAHSVRENGRAAFLAHFSPAGVLVRGGWVEALPALAAQPVAPLVLDWHPAWVEAARSGELGLSTGPWKITPRDASKPLSWGHFVSVWQREDGRWKVLADIGIAHGSAASWSEPLELRVAEHDGPAAGKLDDAERALAQLAAGQGLGAALRVQGTDDLRYYREGRRPLRGLAAVLSDAGADAAPIDFTLQASRVAHSAELGYARGTYRSTRTGAQGVWLRVWRNEGGTWRVALDVANATP
ncbi:MAG TPA: nuclear transport factor 2 family protein [Usitatibacter sp.]|nr:nuclear transport factor 2 family protein [Usitatibacter sp.]